MCRGMYELMCKLIKYSDFCRTEQEATVLVVNKNQPCAILVREHFPHADWMSVAAHSVPVLHQHTLHITWLQKKIRIDRNHNYDWLS